MARGIIQHIAEERRLVTVLFADVVGSTALAEGMDPEDVRALLAWSRQVASQPNEARPRTRARC